MQLPLSITVTFKPVYIQGIQEIENQMVLGIQNNPVDPYIIRKLQP
jgi:hypothetical protein